MRAMRILDDLRDWWQAPVLARLGHLEDMVRALHAAGKQRQEAIIAPILSIKSTVDVLGGRVNTRQPVSPQSYATWEDVLNAELETMLKNKPKEEQH